MPEVLFTGVCTGAVFVLGRGYLRRWPLHRPYAVQLTRKYLRFSQNDTFGTKVPYLVVWNTGFYFY